LSKVIDEIKMRIKVTQGKCRKLIEDSKKIVSKLNVSKDDIVKKKMQVFSEIENSRKSVIETVNKHQDKLITSLNDQIDQYTRSISEAEDKVNSTCNTLEQASSNLEDLVRSENTSHIIKDGKLIEESFEKGTKQQIICVFNK
jgi:uncharacterized protein YoxC